MHTLAITAACPPPAAVRVRSVSAVHPGAAPANPSPASCLRGRIKASRCRVRPSAAGNSGAGSSPGREEGDGRGVEPAPADGEGPEFSMKEVAEGGEGGADQEQGERGGSMSVEMGKAPAGSGGGPHGEGKGAPGGSGWTASTSWHMPVGEQEIAKGGGGAGTEYREKGGDPPGKE